MDAKQCWGLVAGLALAVAACGGDAAETSPASDGGVENSTGKTFAAVLGQDPSLSIAAEQLQAAGLMGALDGAGSYTVLVPTNAAFEGLGAQGSAVLKDPQSRAIVAAVLRNHMVPGVLDTAAIDKAIDDAGGKVTMANFGGGVLSFTRKEGRIAVSDRSGRKAVLGDKVTLVGKGAVIPVDSVLVDPAVLAAPEARGADPG